jgi:hypothetical protein
MELYGNELMRREASTALSFLLNSACLFSGQQIINHHPETERGHVPHRGRDRLCSLTSLSSH